MGMTIDNHIEVLKSYQKGFTGWASNIQDSIDVAIDTMRKYQKIEQIVKNTQQLCSYGSAFIDIREVIEDGKD